MADSSSAQPARPPAVKELVAQAENYRFNPNVAFRYWVRAADTLYQEASFAITDGDYGRAYVMLMRHSDLVLSKLPKHPHFKDPDSRDAFKPLAKRVKGIVIELERLKPDIESAYKEWDQMYRARQAQAQAQSQSQTPRPRRDEPPSYASFAARDPTLTGNAKILDARDNQELAVDLAQQELTRRDTARRATREVGLSDDETLARRRAGLWEWENRSSVSGDNDLQRQMERTRQNLDASREQARDSRRPQQPMPQHYNYPSISKSRPIDYDAAAEMPSPPYPQQPARPPKESLYPNRHEAEALPPRPSKLPPTPEVPSKVVYDHGPPIPSELAAQPARPPKEPIGAEAPPLPKKERLAFKPGGYLENGDPVRPIFLPSKLRQAFLELAADNTRAGLEMCGILCGTPINNAIFIRCLLIPDQKCTSDTCETTNENAVFDYCIGEDLMVLGWIHTHPTQTCFMSSRDLHTQSGYQVMMPESVAIVCAPKFTPSYGIFRLTHPPGLDHILNCTQKETFHQHAVSNLYRECEQPDGHVYESDKMPFYVHDLRGKGGD
jgi:STAM-binding protein